MKKKIISIILILVISCAALTGCTFFSHNSEKDMRQVVAEIASYDITVNVPVDPDDENSVKETKTYTTKKITVYKQDLLDYLNNNYSNLSSSFSDDPEGMVKYAIQLICYTHLVTNEADALIEYKLVDWDKEYTDETGAVKHYYTQSNNIKQNVYSVIDSTLASIKNEILESRGEPTITTPEGSDSSTTYPVPSDDNDDDETAQDKEGWQPSLVNYPGLNGDAEYRSLEKEAMRRFISLIQERTSDDFRITAEEKEKFADDKKRIQEVIDKDGIEAVYPMLGETYYMYYLAGKTATNNLKINTVQQYIEESAVVSEDDIVARYNALLAEQVESYTQSISNYYTAVSGSNTVLYVPDRNYFYVKHILLPFSDEQTAKLTEYKALPNVTEKQINEFRAGLVDGIVAYKHVNGENDTSVKYSVDRVMKVVNATMSPYKNNPEKAERTFNSLIYDFNTDTGIFDNTKGYAVKYKLDDGESETYMQEFADASREMYDAYFKGTFNIGQVWQTPVVTDYGVHIMYLANIPKVTSNQGVGLNSYTSPGKIETYHDIIKEELLTTLKSKAYQNWEDEKTLYYERNGTVVYHESRYKDLWS